jgi:predicted nucleotidyltransferase
MSTLDDLFPRARVGIFRQLFEDPAKEIHLRDLARLARLTPAALQRELGNLATNDLVIPRRDGNRLYFRKSNSHPLYPELHGLVIKTTGIASKLRQALLPVDGIDLAFIFGSTDAGTPGSSSDLDVLILGSVGLRKVTLTLRSIALSLGREVNPYCLTADEWTAKRAAGDAFVSRVATEPKLWLKGGPHALATMGR